jgi:hypothetical protein
MKRRKVIEVERVERHAFKLKLECGHTVVKRDGGRKAPPKAIICDACAILLDRCRQADGWFSSRQIRGPHAALRLLEDEGLVDSSKAFHGASFYWKARPE